MHQLVLKFIVFQPLLQRFLLSLGSPSPSSSQSPVTVSITFFLSAICRSPSQSRSVFRSLFSVLCCVFRLLGSLLFGFFSSIFGVLPVCPSLPPLFPSFFRLFHYVHPASLSNSSAQGTRIFRTGRLSSGEVFTRYHLTGEEGLRTAWQKSV